MIRIRSFVSEYPNEEQEIFLIVDTSECVDEEDEEEISFVQEDRGDNLVSYIQSQRGKLDTHIEVDGKLYFKASILKQCFEDHLTSTDRLRKYVISPSDNVQNVDNIVLLGDTVLVKINGDLRIAVIKEIIRGKSKLKRATPEELAHFSLSLKEVKTITPPDFQQRLLWTDEVGEILKAKSDVVTVIQPNQDQNGKY